jgi:site-specific recombinase XerD
MMDRGGIQKSLKAIAKSCGIRKHVTPHTLRHCYGALSLEAGVNLRAIQHEMGHERPNTTALYTQLTDTTQLDTSQLINRMLAPLCITWGA